MSIMTNCHRPLSAHKKRALGPEAGNRGPYFPQMAKHFFFHFYCLNMRKKSTCHTWSHTMVMPLKINTPFPMAT